METRRRAPREQRHLRFACQDDQHGQVLDLSAVGLRVRTPKAWANGTRVGPLTLTFEDGRRAEVTAVVVWVKRRDAAAAEMGLDLLEANRDYFDRLAPVRPSSV